MEKTLSVEERIRRAENIYNKRNGIQYSKIDKNPKKREKKNIKKILIHMIIILFIYVIIYIISNREHIFSEEFRNETYIFFTEKTNINKWYMNIKESVEEFFGVEESNNQKVEDKKGENNESEKEIENENKNIEEPKQESESKESEKQNDGEEKNKEENIGGSTDTEGENNNNLQISEQDQIKKEVEAIKKQISFIKPIQGRISSTFGWRNPTTSNVPKYHTGIDIAANEGTKILSATDGKIVMASTQGDYGNHYQIKIQDIIIVYAHCKKLYFKEGQTVKQGQEIAEVGTTGNSTGPHLHFEIRKGNEKIDPQLIIDF